MRFLPLVIWMLLTTPVLAASGNTDSAGLEAAARRYVTAPLTADLSGLTAAEKEMIPLLRAAALAMEPIFWAQSYGDHDALFSLPWNPTARQLLRINSGPWDRLEGNRPLFPGMTPKPLGANFYPPDLTREALEAALTEQEELKHPYSLVRRDPTGALHAVPYHQAFFQWVTLAADRLRRAADLAGDPGLARYLTLRAEALLTDQYQASDKAWMEMKNNRLDLIIGPIETYEDGLLGVKSAHEALLLIKDPEWDRRLAGYAKKLTEYQHHLPTPPRYRAETPGADSDLGVYDVILMTGDAAVTRPIAINLPNDAEVQLEKGSRRLQLRNAMEVKFARILLPMARELLDPEQLPLVTFAAFFANTLFHEVAHGLGIKKTVNGQGTVTDALREDAWMMEEGKADALSLLLGDMDTEDARKGDLVDEKSRYITEFASLFRSIRFGPTSSHARANLIRFNYLQEQNAFTRNEEGRYRANMATMRAASSKLAGEILRLQGEGDLAGVRALEKQYGVISPELAADLRRVEDTGIPTDVVFQQ